MSVFLTKILWYQLKDRGTEAIGDNQYKDPVNITDAVIFNVAKGIDIKNNILTLTVKNPHNLYVDTYNDLQFEEQDQIKIFINYTDTGADVSASAWDTTTITEPTTQYLLGVYYVIEVSGDHSAKSTLINLKCADKTYILFNKVLAKAFITSDALTAPQIIQKVIRFSSQTTLSKGGFVGTGSDPRAYYDVDAKLESEGGFITDVRRVTREDGTTNSDTLFPEIQMAKVWKPIYEWISELSQIEKTNTTSELTGTTALVYGRPFIFWIDESNRFHWIYPTDTTADYIEVGLFRDETLSYDSSQTNDVEVFNVDINKKVFDVTNMIIFNAGNDMYNTGIWGYVLDTTSNAKTLKMRVVPMIDIAEKWKNLDYKEGTVAANREGTPAGKPLYQFPLDARYPLSDVDGDDCVFIPTTSFATNASITNDTNYNDALRERATDEAELRAKALLGGLSHARWKGSITTKGRVYSVGNLVEFTDTSLGLYRQKLRIMDVRHNIRKNSWTTEVELEQDQKALITSANLN